MKNIRALYFGSEVAVSGNTACIAQRGGASPGIYLFDRDHGGVDNWGEVKRLKRGDLGVSTSGDFARGVAISGDVAAVGVPGDTPGDDGSTGAVYLLEGNSGGADNWGLLKKNVADSSDYSFGDTIALSGDTLAVTSDRSVHVYSRDLGGADNWGLIKKLRRKTDEESLESFGYSVAISGDTVLIGSPSYMGVTGEGTGAAYVWEP